MASPITRGPLWRQLRALPGQQVQSKETPYLCLCHSYWLLLPSLFPESSFCSLSLSSWRGGKETPSVRPSKGTSRSWGGETDFEKRTTQWGRGEFTSSAYDQVADSLKGGLHASGPGQEASEHRTLPRHVSQQEEVQWGGWGTKGGGDWTAPAPAGLPDPSPSLESLHPSMNSPRCM